MSINRSNLLLNWAFWISPKVLAPNEINWLLSALLQEHAPLLSSFDVYPESTPVKERVAVKAL
jgi:hypothetical protein